MQKTQKTDRLDEALAAWRQADAAPTFSAGARASILERARHVRHETELPRLARLFVPLAKIAYAGAVPVLLLALTLGWLGANPARVSAPGEVRIEAGKVDGEAVFRIANGGRVHQVFRSTNPRANADRELLTTTQERFSDSLGGTSGVVYYRID